MSFERWRERKKLVNGNEWVGTFITKDELFEPFSIVMPLVSLYIAAIVLGIDNIPRVWLLLAAFTFPIQFVIFTFIANVLSAIAFNLATMLYHNSADKSK